MMRRTVLGSRSSPVPEHWNLAPTNIIHVGDTCPQARGHRQKPLAHTVDSICLIVFFVSLPARRSFCPTVFDGDVFCAHLAQRTVDAVRHFGRRLDGGKRCHAHEWFHSIYIELYSMYSEYIYAQEYMVKLAFFFCVISKTSKVPTQGFGMSGDAKALEEDIFGRPPGERLREVWAGGWQPQQVCAECLAFYSACEQVA